MRKNIIIFVVVCFISVGLLFASNTYTALAFALITICLPLLGIALAHLVARKTRLSFSMERACAVGQSLAMEIKATRTPLWRGSINLLFECRNITNGDIKHVPVTLLPASGKVEEFTLELGTTTVGAVDVKLIEASASDPLGFTSIPLKSIEFASSYMVYPELVDITIQASQAIRSDIMGTEYDRTRKGQDQTEVFDTREFQQGDSFKRVHWKLSARFEDLLVREPSLPADCDIAIIAAIEAGNPEDKQRIDVYNATFSMAASISLALFQQDIVHSVCRGAKGALEFNEIDSRKAFDAALDLLVATPYPQKSQFEEKLLLLDQWKSSHVVAKTIFVTNSLEEELLLKLAETTNLTVVYVSPSEGVGVAGNARYRMVHVSTDMVGAGIKSLEL